MRKKIVAGNWKMNKNFDEAMALASEVKNMVNTEVTNNTIVVLCVPFPFLYPVGKLLEGSRVALGAQNAHEKEAGAYTGEVSAGMLKSVGATYVILGHSERREYFKETNTQLAEKINLAIKHGFTPIFCCGESLDQRNQNIHISFVKSQLDESLFHLSESDFKKIVIAYEPIWAIGTGVTATTEQAQEMHNEIRQHIASRYGTSVASEISILYGGSCKPDNAKELFACPDVDGGLIGGASLKARDFVDIIKSF
ncbi:MAG: triose-phosphate isomerase [Cytophagaceae bacterium]|nr:triose-phosphate isomerase [Cytophagaceae bacterium]MDW8456164.1 triose-phosphate isomerase [Cytophagaceae bacterium]